MIYETEADRKKESGVFGAISLSYSCEIEMCPPLSPADGYLIDSEGSRRAVVEVKNRRNAHNHYPTYMLSALKHGNLMRIATSESIPALLVVNFTDGLYATKLKDNYQMASGGRYDRANPKDVEQCIYIPIKEFKNICK